MIQLLPRGRKVERKPKCSFQHPQKPIPVCHCSISNPIRATKKTESEKKNKAEEPSKETMIIFLKKQSIQPTNIQESEVDCFIHLRDFTYWDWIAWSWWLMTVCQCSRLPAKSNGKQESGHHSRTLLSQCEILQTICIRKTVCF